MVTVKSSKSIFKLETKSAADNFNTFAQILVKLVWYSVTVRGVANTNNAGRLLADKNSTRHRALAKFSIHLNRKQHPIWRLT